MGRRYSPEAIRFISANGYKFGGRPRKPEGVICGTRSGYQNLPNHHDGCERCLAANRASIRAYRQKKATAAKTREDLFEARRARLEAAREAARLRGEID